MRIEVDWDTCAGHGSCEGVAPDVFELDDDGNLQLLVEGDLPDNLLPGARNAVFGCPEHALRLVKSEGET
jgi:ferredoxin